MNIFRSRRVVVTGYIKNILQEEAEEEAMAIKKKLICFRKKQN